MKVFALAIGLAGFAAAMGAQAAEIIKYTYDAKGRLVKAVHGGTVNNGVKVIFAYDKADNRQNVKVTGAP